MPARKPGDGPVAVRLDDGDNVAIEVMTDGVTKRVVMGEYNAWRVFGMLSLLLKIPLPAATGRAIKLGTLEIDRT